eukprot:5393668-Alexandrium_andersonii.AAC.1
MAPCVVQKQKPDRPAKVLDVEVPVWMPHEVFAHYFATDHARTGATTTAMPSGRHCRCARIRDLRIAR